jgi:hypothetical protein
MLRLFARWRALAARERCLLLGLMAGLPVIAAMLRLLGVMRTTRLLDRTSEGVAPRRADPFELNDARRVAQLTALAGRRGLIAATCLRQALLVYWLLRRRGFAPELKLGVRNDADAFVAHAWIELQGMTLGEGEAAYVPFVAFGPRGPTQRAACP